jgi:hypothetical protein
MANNLSRNPWYVDTASANYLRSGTATPNGAIGSAVNPGIGFTGAPYQGKGPIGISSIIWSGYTVASHTVVIKDVNGNTIYSLVGHTDLSPVNLDFDFPLAIWDIAVTTIGSGFVALNLSTYT